MYFHYIKDTFILKATYLGGFANLKVSLLFLLFLVKDKINIEQYEKNIKSSCYYCRALYFHQSKK